MCKQLGLLGPTIWEQSLKRLSLLFSPDILVRVVEKVSSLKNLKLGETCVEFDLDWTVMCYLLLCLKEQNILVKP